MAGDDHLEGIKTESTDPQSRTQRLVEMFTNREDAADATETHDDSRAEFAGKVQTLNKSGARAWSQAIIKQLTKLLGEAVAKANQKAQVSDPDNPFAHHQAQESVRSQLRQLVAALNPPQEVIDSAEFQELMDHLRPKAAKMHKSGFEREPMMRGQVRSDVMNRQVSEAVTEADRRATQKRVASLKKAGADRVAIENATKTLAGLVKLIKRRKKKKKVSDVDDAAEAAEVEPEEELTKTEAEEITAKALLVMQTLREEIAPRWAPTQQPWFLNAADNEVYAILLAVVPKGLFEETEAYDEMQDLRAGQEVFTLRAADKTSEAVKRNK